MNTKNLEKNLKISKKSPKTSTFVTFFQVMFPVSVISTISGIFRATKNLIFALDPLCTLNVKITLLYESGRYRWGEGGQKITSIGRYL